MSWSAQPLFAQIASPGDASGRVLYHPYLPNDTAGQQSSIEIVNFGLQTSEFTAQFYNAAGVPSKRLNGSLAPGELHQIDLAAQPDLPDGAYSLILESNGPLYSVVRVLTPPRLDSTVGGLGLYQGVTDPRIDLTFGPVTGGSQGSQLVLMNATTSPATVQLDYFDRTAELVVTSTVEIAPLATVRLPPPARMPTNFSGLAIARTNRAVAGLLVQRQSDDGLELIPAQQSYTLAVRGAATANVRYPLPRLLYDLDLGGGPRTSTVLAAFAGEGQAQGSVIFSTTEGWPIDPAVAFTLTGKTAMQMPLPNGPAGFGAAMLTGDEPLFVIEQTKYTRPSPYATAGYGAADLAACANRLPLPLVVREPARYSVFYVQNIDLDTVEITITYRDRSGATEAIRHHAIPAGGTQQYDLRQVAGLPTDFVGSAEIFTPYRLLCAHVDEYLVGEPTKATDLTMQTRLFLPAILEQNE